VKQHGNQNGAWSRITWYLALSHSRLQNTSNLHKQAKVHIGHRSCLTYGVNSLQKLRGCLFHPSSLNEAPAEIEFSALYEY